MHQYERDIFLLHGIARSDVTMDLQCVRMVHHLAASQLRQYLKSHSHLELNHRVPHVLQRIKINSSSERKPTSSARRPLRFACELFSCRSTTVDPYSSLNTKIRNNRHECNEFELSRVSYDTDLLGSRTVASKIISSDYTTDPIKNLKPLAKK